MSRSGYTKHGFKLWLPGQTTPNKLYRFGNSLSPRLSNVRIDDIPYRYYLHNEGFVPHYNHESFVNGARGVSTYSNIYRVNDSSYPVAINVWSLEKGSLIVPGLTLVQDNEDRFIFAPEKSMREPEYVEALNIQGQTEGNARFLRNQNSWISEQIHPDSFESFVIQSKECDFDKFLPFKSGLDRIFVDGLRIQWKKLILTRKNLYEEFYQLESPSPNDLNLIEDTISDVELEMYHLNSYILSMRNGASVQSYLAGHMSVASCESWTMSDPERSVD